MLTQLNSTIKKTSTCESVLRACLHVCASVCARKRDGLYFFKRLKEFVQGSRFLFLPSGPGQRIQPHSPFSEHTPKSHNDLLTEQPDLQSRSSKTLHHRVSNEVLTWASSSSSNINITAGLPSSFETSRQAISRPNMCPWLITFTHSCSGTAKWTHFAMTAV